MNKAIYHPAYRAAVARLKQARLDCGLTHKQVAQRLGHHRAWVGKVECCELRLDVLTFVRYCRAVGVSATELVAGIEEGIEEDPFFLPISRPTPESRYGAVTWIGAATSTRANLGPRCSSLRFAQP